MAKVTPNNPKAPSARPGVQEPAAAKPHKEKITRVFHPLLNPGPVMVDGVAKVNKKGQQIIKPTAKLEKIPDDFNPKLHKPLGRSDFADESQWYELRARELEQKAQQLRKQGEEMKKIGNVKDRAAAKKLMALQKRIAELQEGLVSKGVDVSAIMALLQTKQDANKPADVAAPASNPA